MNIMTSGQKKMFKSLHLQWNVKTDDRVLFPLTVQIILYYAIEFNLAFYLYDDLHLELYGFPFRKRY